MSHWDFKLELLKLRSWHTKGKKEEKHVPFCFPTIYRTEAVLEEEEGAKYFRFSLACSSEMDVFV